jgi:hypothetical protein
MNRVRQQPWTVVAALIILVAIGLMPSLARPGDTGNSNPRILPPEANPYGQSYSEWVAAFWQWALALPVEGHPFSDADEAHFDFAAHQSGQVWFWSAPDGPLTRHVTLPAGKALFLTLRDVEVSSLEEPPFFGATEEEQRDLSEWFADHIVDVFCVIDGVPVQNLADYRFSSPQFQFTAPTPWIFGNTGGNGTSVGDGYYLMLAPMSAGHHTIHYGGTFHFEAGELFDFPLDLPKDITIEMDVQ